MNQPASGIERMAHTKLTYAGARLILLGPLVSIAFGRWGSYIGVPGAPIYLSDVLVAAGIIALILGRDRRTTPRESHQLRTTSGHWGLVGIALIPIVIGVYRAPGDLVLLVRDAAPFVYLALIPVVAFAVNVVGRHYAMRLLSTAVILHTLWFAPAMLDLAPEFSLPFVGVPVFTTRGDFDVLICGLTVVVLIVERRGTPILRLILIASAVGAGLLSGSRSGLLAGITVGLVAFLLLRPWRNPQRGGARSAGVALALAGSIAGLQFLGAAAPQWAIGLQKLIPSSSATYQSGQNTWEARQMAWSRVIDFVTSDSSAGDAALGTGFGSQPVLESGAVAFLSGDTAVRAAHNFIVTWFAFTGYVGITAVIILFAIILLRGIRTALTESDIPAVVGVAMMVGVLLTAGTGVILESPFGYMTFVFFSALALSKPTPRSDEGTDGSIPSSLNARHLRTSRSRSRS